MDRSRRRVASFVAVVAVLSRVIDAITLRSSDALEYNVSTSAAVGHSKLLREVVGACGDNTAVPLPTVGGTELELIVEFINAFEVDDVIPLIVGRDASTPLMKRCAPHPG